MTLENLREKGTFFILLFTLPALIFANLMYLQTTDDKDALHIAYSGLDIIDMAELIFADVGCYQTFGAGWMAAFYIGCLLSAFLIPFMEYGLEQPAKRDYSRKDKLATFCNLLFNDVFFLVLRIVTMDKTHHVYFGVIFVIKEASSVIIRGKLLWDSFH